MQQPAAGRLLLSLVFVLSSQIAGNAGEFSLDQRLELVVAHNRVRESVAPSATSLSYLTWDKELEYDAKARVGSLCKQSHPLKNYTSRSGWLVWHTFGENLPQTWSIVNDWHGQRRSYSPTSSVCLHGTLENCGGYEYSQLVLDKLTRFGCSHQMCHGKLHLVICRYSHSAIDFQQSYKSGISCTSCPTKTPLCRRNLCVSKEYEALPEMQLFDASAKDYRAMCKLSCSVCEQQNGDCRCLCQNDGTPLSGTTAADCHCHCKTGFYGRHCAVGKTIRDASAILRLKRRANVGLPASLLYTSLWTGLQAVIAESLNAYCKSGAEAFAQCCNGRVYTEALDSSEFALTDASRIDFALDLVEQEEDGALSVFVYATVDRSMDKNGLCYWDAAKPAAAHSRLKRNAPGKKQALVPSVVLRDALLKYRNQLNAKLMGMKDCQDVMLISVASPGVQMSKAPRSNVHHGNYWMAVSCLGVFAALR